MLNRALHAFRLVTADPHVHEIVRDHTLVARIGYGAGEQVAEGQWTEAHELVPVERKRRRAALLRPQERLAALLTGRQRALACEELALRARLDLDHAREREAALQVLVALDAALAELPPTRPPASSRTASTSCGAGATAPRAPPRRRSPGSSIRSTAASVEFALGRLEAALRARAAALVELVSGTAAVSRPARRGPPRARPRRRRRG